MVKYGGVVVDPFKWYVRYCFGEKAYKKAAEYYGFEVVNVPTNATAVCLLMEEASGATYSLLYFKEESPSISLVTHEVVHCVLDMMLDRGIPVNHENNEVIAYCCEHLVGELSKVACKKAVKKKGKKK